MTADEGPQDRIDALETRIGEMSGTLEALRARIDALEATGPARRGGAAASATPPPAPRVAPMPAGPTPPFGAPASSGAETPFGAPAPLGAPGPLPHDGGSSSPLRRDRTSRFVVVLLASVAAFLVLLAGTSLIALVWTSIPDSIKIAIVGGFAFLATWIGAVWGPKDPGGRATAAALTGIGAALGYVTGIGAALLSVVDPLPAFVFLVVWTVVTTLLATRRRMPFTLVPIVIGGIASLALLDEHAGRHPGQALLAHALVLAYVVASLATALVAARTMSGRAKRWTLASAAAVATPALMFTPMEASWRQSPTAAGILTAGLALVSLGAVVLLVRDPEHRAWQWAWLLVPVIVAASCGTYLEVLPDEGDRVLVVLLHLALTAALIGAAATPRICGPHGGVAEYALIVPSLAIPHFAGVGGSLAKVLLVASWAVILATALLAARRRSAPHLVLVPLLGIGLCAHSGLGVVWALLIVISAVLTTVLLDRSGANAPARTISLHLGLVLVLVALPWALLSGSADPRPLEGALALSVTAGAFVLATILLFLGASANGAGPADLWLARVRLARASLRAPVDARPTPTAAVPVPPPFPRPGTPASLSPAPLFGPPAGYAQTFPAPIPPVSEPPASGPWPPNSARGIGHGASAAGARLAPANALAVLALALLLLHALPATAFPGLFDWGGEIPSSGSALRPIVPLGIALFAPTLAWALRPVTPRPIYGALLVLVEVDAVTTAASRIRALDDLPWAVTFLVLLVGACAIGAGFRWRANAVRLTGLVVVLLSILKLAFIDSGIRNDFSGVLTLFVSGAVCLVLSYSYAKASQNAREKERRLTERDRT